MDNCEMVVLRLFLCFLVIPFPELKTTKECYCKGFLIIPDGP